MDEKIRSLRLSFWWSAAFSTLLDDAVPADAPLAPVGRPETYSPIFEQLLARPGRRVPTGPGSALSLELPWPHVGVHWFWCRYLGANPIRKVSGQLAFTGLVPFRRQPSPARDIEVRLPAELELPADTRVRCRGEGWYFPHMVAFGITFDVESDVSLLQMVQVCFALRRDPVFVSDQRGTGRTLDAVATDWLGRLLVEALGERNTGPQPIADPFSILTVIRGEVKPEHQVEDGSEVHLALEQLGRWQPGPSGPLSAARISSKDAHPRAPLLLGHARSRVVWDPARFSSTGLWARRSSLSCYHRNSFASTLQTEALLAFASLADERARTGRIPRVMRLCESSVFKRCAALHRGAPHAYRSKSLQTFIDAHPAKPAMNGIAARIGEPPLP